MCVGGVSGRKRKWRKGEEEGLLMFAVREAVNVWYHMQAALCVGVSSPLSWLLVTGTEGTLW